MLNYDMPLFRPPSEAHSLILQVTLGCSWNRCSYCEMYTSKKFRPRPQAEIEADITAVGSSIRQYRKVFMADGNAMVLSSKRLMPILAAIKQAGPHIERVSAYAMPGDILRKSDEELRQLAEAGLTMLYVGVETGSDELLQRIDKGETQATSIESIQRAEAAGIQTSVMILNGIGGRLYSAEHARESAIFLNAAEPTFTSTLVLSFPTGEDRFREKFGNGFEPMDQHELFVELRSMLGQVTAKTQFRSDHASNWLPLKGTLPADKDRLLAQLDGAIHQPEATQLRPEWARGL